MKIGIITIYNGYNYGAYWQAYALSTYLKNKGHEVYFIRHKARKPGLMVARAAAKAVCAFDYPVCYQRIKMLLGVIKYQKKFDFCTREEANSLDLVIAGSDEIWNVAREAVRNEKIFFGEGITSKKIAYAPSLNKSVEEDFNKYPEIISLIDQFADISVRDNGSRTVLENLLGRKVRVVVDPTLLLDASEYRKVEKKYDIPSKYCLVYSYAQGNSGPVVENFLKSGGNSGLKTVSLMHYWPNADYNVGTDPFKAMYLFDNAEFVLTDTFHGIMMSLVFGKELVISCVTSQKVADVIELLGIQDRVVSDDNSVSSILSRTMDYDTIREKLGYRKAEANTFLNEWLS